MEKKHNNKAAHNNQTEKVTTQLFNMVPAYSMQQDEEEEEEEEVKSCNEDSFEEIIDRLDSKDNENKNNISDSLSK